jgi:hypothetical protein
MVFSFAIGKERELTINTIDDIQKLHICTIPFGEHLLYILHYFYFVINIVVIVSFHLYAHLVCMSNITLQMCPS